MSFNPFHDDKQGYSYFSIEAITKGVKINKKRYELACNIVNKGEAKIVNTKFGYLSDINSGMIAEFLIKINDKTLVHIVISNDELLDISCSELVCKMSAQYIYSGNNICEHKLAGLILVDKYIKENNPGDSTNGGGFIFLNSFLSENTLPGIHSENTVRLIPQLIVNDRELHLRVLISANNIKREYIVNNIPKLFETVRQSEKYSLGKNNEIDFSCDSFSDESKPLIELLKSWIRDIIYQFGEEYYEYSNYNDTRKYCILFGDRLDRFYELFVGQSVKFDRKSKVEIKSANPKLTVTLKKLLSPDGRFEGLNLTGVLPLIIVGGKYTYFINENELCRIEPEYSRQIEPFINLSQKNDSESGCFSICIGRKNLQSFYYTVLPQLRKIATVIEPDDIISEEFLPPEVFFRFYLDIDNGTPECRVETRYGETGVAVFDLLYNNILKEDFRDKRREQQVLNAVMHYFPEFQREKERFVADNDSDTLYSILENAVPLFLQLGEVVSTDRFQNSRIRPKLGMTIGVSVESDILNLSIEAENITPNELLDIVKSYRQKKKYHRLKNGEFINLDENIAELSAMMEAMHISPKEFVKGKMQLPAYRALYLDKMLEKNEEIYTKRDSNYKRLIKSFKTVDDSDFEIPESLQKTMRPYQHFGHRWLRTIESFGFGGILADDMGLGKTLQMISVLLATKKEDNLGTALIVCPASLVFNWIAEFEKFAPSLDVIPVTGTLKERTELIENWQKHDVLVTSYDLLKRDVANYENCEFSYQVLDEAQYIKNHNTAAAKSVKIIHAKHKFALTGTPIENRLSELWSIFDYLMPGLLYGYDMFKKEFETPIVKKSDEETSKRLRRMTSPFILRRLKQDVLKELPDKLEEDYIVRMDEEQRNIYDAKVLELRQMLDKQSEENFQSGKLKILAMLTQIRQICCDPSLLFADYTGNSAKKEACIEIIQRAIEGEHRILIFSQFTSMLSLLENELETQNISYYKITGETPKKKRLELVNEFNNGNTPVFLISLKAGGTGLNLTGADVVIHYDPWWNVAAQNQATDRAHRIGQKKNVTVYKLIAKNTIEEKIQEMQKKKSSLAETILTGEIVNFASLSKDELMNILN